MHDLDKLPAEMQKKVQDFVQAMLVSKSAGVRGKALLKFSGILAASEAKKLMSAVNEGCGTVDINEW